MGFFKPSGEEVSSRSIKRLQNLIWILIYGGLLTAVLGLFVQRTHDPIGWSMVSGGVIVAAVGFFLVWVRSRIRSEPL